MPILKLSKHNKQKEVEFELRYLSSLTIQERFQMMFNKSMEIRALLQRHEHRKPAKVFKRI